MAKKSYEPMTAIRHKQKHAKLQHSVVLTQGIRDNKYLSIDLRVSVAMFFGKNTGMPRDRFTAVITEPYHQLPN